MKPTDFPGIAPRVSHTAFTAAAAPAADLLADAGPNPFSGSPVHRPSRRPHRELLTCHRLHGRRPIPVGARAEAVCRTGFTEARPMRINSGIYQYPIPGAGSIRSRIGPHRTIAAVRDRPLAARAVKRERPVGAEPATVTFAPVAFEADRLREPPSRVDSTRFAPCPPAGWVSPRTGRGRRLPRH
ncbi:hypothetical protein AB0M80_25330 [Amycolatopsis sp. NPDC051045]|uniref:hypothetical protein n=1 Tax=Amycolatopsis sp. NPDC051045 TaxID=3156922 RepID=UPI00341EC858